MKLKKREGVIERQIIIGMIMDETLLGNVAARWVKEGLFASRWTNLVGTWCVDYFNKYSEAPGPHVEGLYEAWASTTRDTDTSDIVASFLEGLSGEYEAASRNSDYSIDIANELFARVRLEKLKEALSGDLDNGEVMKALKRVETFAHVDIGASQGIDVLSDFDALKKAFKKRAKPLIHYPGALGAFFRKALVRDSLVAFMGPEKRGKTMWLLDIAWRAMQQGLRVAMFEVGDMSEDQILMRFAARACERPMDATDPEKAERIPTAIEHAPECRHATVEYVEKSWDEPLSFKEARKRLRQILKDQGQDKGLFKLSCHPNSSLTVQGMASVLDTWHRSGWGIPDVVVVDYADVLSAPSGHAETRDQINATWKQLRAMSQSLHCCVVTATQSDADSYSAETMTMGNFSEDKRKNAHVTGMVGINQSPEERKQGIQRLNWLALREGSFSADDHCHVAGCFALANPAMFSIF